MEAYSLDALQSILHTNIYYLLTMCEDSYQQKLHYNDKVIEKASYVKFITWYNKNYTDAIELPKKVERRKYSTSHRIEIAYKCKWKCNLCGNMLKPDFQVDHIIELRDGGKDEYMNLQALCVSCHSEKTRINTLKQHESFKQEFSRRSKELETASFKKFVHVRKSKYF